MQINRFSQRDRLRSTYQPQEYIPNFELLAQALGQQQIGYDQAIEASSKLPQYRQIDKQAVLAYEEENRKRMEAVTQAYKKDGIQGGNVARKEFLNKIKQDYSTTGKAYGIQANYEAKQKYIEKLDEMRKLGPDKGGIRQEVYDAAIREANRTAKTSYDEDGNYTQYKGFNPTGHVHVQKRLDEAAKGFEEDSLGSGAIMNGRRVFKDIGGQYYTIQNDKKTFIDDQDIRDFVKQTAYADPEMMGFLQQETQLFGTLNATKQRYKLGEDGKPLVDQQGNPIIEIYQEEVDRGQYILNSAEDALANKYGFMRTETTETQKMNWWLKMREEQKFKKKMEDAKKRNLYDGTINTTLINSGLELPTIAGKSSTDIVNNIFDLLIPKTTKTVTTTAGRGGIGIIPNLSYNKQQNKERKKLEDAFKGGQGISILREKLSSPEGRKAMPGANEMLETVITDLQEGIRMQRQGGRGANLPVVVSGEDVAAELGKRYNSYAREVKVQRGEINEYDAQSDLAKDVHKALFSDGNVFNRQVSILGKDHKPGETFTFQTFTENYGVQFDPSDPKATASNFGVSGEIGVNSISPSGFIAKAKTSDGPIEFLVHTSSLEQDNYMGTQYNAMKASYNPLGSINSRIAEMEGETGVGFSENFIDVPVNEGTVPGVYKFTPQYNGLTGKTEIKGEVYTVTTNTEGKITNLTPVQGITPKMIYDLNWRNSPAGRRTTTYEQNNQE